jgi:diguanylate cyclase (GGDEF)-like protein
MRVNPNAFPTDLPELLERFLNAHRDSMIAVVREPMFTRVPPDSAHAFFAPFTEAPVIKTFGRDAHVRAIHAARAARLDGSAHMVVSHDDRDLHLSAVSILGTEYLVLILHETEGIGSLTAVPHVDGVTVFRGTCDDQLNLLSIDHSLAAKVGLDADTFRNQTLDFLVDDDSITYLIDCWVDSTALGAASCSVQLRNAGGPNDRWYEATIFADDDRTDFVLVNDADNVRAVGAQEHRTRLRNIAETVPHGIFRISSRGQLLYKNSKLDDIFGREFRSHDDFGDMQTVDGTPLSIAVRNLLTDVTEGQVDIVHDVRGEERTIRLRVRTYIGSSGFPEYVGSAEDLTDEIKRSSKLKEEALTDPMTGTANRRALELTLGEILEAPDAQSVAVLLCDLDGFKQVNDSLGHGAGDDVIAEVGRRLQEVCRDGDMVARLGGDEFVVVARDVPDYEQAMEFAHRLLPLLRKPFSIADTQIELSGSVGVAVSSQDSSVLGILQMADHAMYEAKRAGRNQAVSYHSPDSANSLSPLALRRDLRRAIAANGLDLAFQPIFAIHDLENPESAEALLRWNHPTQGRIDPSTMILIAEQSGLIRDLGEWIVTESIRSAAAVNQSRKSGRPISIAVNVSAQQVGRPEFVDMVAASLDFNSLDPSLLTLELTESFLIDRVDNARKAIAELSDLGVRLAVDDFGTGYSTFEYLLSLPVFAVKIDPSFTKRLTEPRGAAMLRGLSSACRELDMLVIAEGIETIEQLNAARRAGVTHAQGYLLGMPVSTVSLGMRENSAA